MTFPEDQLAELKRLCPEVRQCEEAGCTYLLLPGLRLPEGCNPSVIDALLCPTTRDGYASRLFFAERVQSRAALNWNANRVRILERNWDAFSWRMSAEPRLIQMLAAHLRAFK
jgi:hypothetical protein